MMLSELGNALFKELSQIVNGGDDQVKPDLNKFVIWCIPGLPFEARDFNFAHSGVLQARRDPDPYRREPGCATGVGMKGLRGDSAIRWGSRFRLFLPF